MERVIAKFRTYQEADEATREYYRSLSPMERIEILFELRERSQEERDETSGRLARVYRIVQLKSS